MTRKTKPFHRITMARAELDMAVQHPDIYDEDRLRALVVEAHYAVTQLMAFRNIINGMVGFDEDPREAARPYIDEDV